LEHAARGRKILFQTNLFPLPQTASGSEWLFAKTKRRKDERHDHDAKALRRQPAGIKFIALNRLKKSQRNARKVPHTKEEIEALAASEDRGCARAA